MAAVPAGTAVLKVKKGFRTRRGSGLLGWFPQHLGSGDTDMMDRRAHPRRRSFLGSRIIVNGLASTIDCYTRNVSDGGVMIEIDPAVDLPSEIQFVLRPGAARVPGHVVWRAGRHAGIACAI